MTRKSTFQEIFSYEQLGKEPGMKEYSVYIASQRQPWTEFFLWAGKAAKEKKQFEGRITFDDVGLLEYVQGILKEQERACVGLLCTGFDLRQQSTVRLTLTLQTDYLTRSIRLDWHSERRLQRWWNETDQKAFAGLYYAVLGGAYCSLGKENQRYAYKAGELALKQIQLAKELRDPLLECKCWLYFAEDLIQLGRLKKANRILNRQRLLIDCLQDVTLRSMLYSVEAKLCTAIQVI
ncbi:hypothetical protein BY458DRAFT_560659 [Sporodiniella umbellata]|nr:hypothetical protein BY458DRAFT_560659 [Sporodiniella umbellata]